MYAFIEYFLLQQGACLYCLYWERLKVRLVYSSTKVNTIFMFIDAT